MPEKKVALDPNALSRVRECTLKQYRKKQIIFAQGSVADSVFCVEKGRVKLTVASPQGKAAVVGILGPKTFFGEGCLAGQAFRIATAIALTECSVLRLGKAATLEALQKNPGFSEIFMTYLLSRNVRIEEDLIDQLFNSSERRLARILLLLANFGKDGKEAVVVPKVSQETLAEMIGTTRSRVSFFMNKFQKLGFIHYQDGLRVRDSLLNFVLRD